MLKPHRVREIVIVRVGVAPHRISSAEARGEPITSGFRLAQGEGGSREEYEKSPGTSGRIGDQGLSELKPRCALLERSSARSKLASSMPILFANRPSLSISLKHKKPNMPPPYAPSETLTGPSATSRRKSHVEIRRRNSCRMMWPKAVIKWSADYPRLTNCRQRKANLS